MRRIPMQALLVLLIVLSTVVLGGCDVIGNIFQAGMWVGMVIVVLILAGVAFLVAKIRR
jgi:hypothetical protein